MPSSNNTLSHDDVIGRKHSVDYSFFGMGIHHSLVVSPNKMPLIQSFNAVFVVNLC